MPLHLSDAEKRDIIKYLEAGKPLPEKYRFLLFKADREVELLWNGKTDEVTNVVLPFQAIEQIDEPRAEGKIGVQDSLFDTSGRQVAGWTNKLIWGDNKLILSSLKNGPLRKEIEAQGGLKLIYIDPPFDVGADFSMDLEIGDEQFTKKPSVIEEIAYRDTWGKGADSFIAMIYERLKLMHELLTEDGSIYIHCDWRLSGHIRLILDEVFRVENFVNEIIWHYEGPQSPSSLKFGSKHDTIFRYAKNIKNNEAQELYYFEKEPFHDKAYQKDQNGKYFYTIPKGDYSPESIERLDREGKIFWTGNGTARIKKFVQLSDDGKWLLKEKKIPDVWEITSLGLAAGSKENLDYPTQKPEALLERIMRASSKEGDLVADFFCGSGTTLAVAEKLGRKWIGSDLGKFGVHTSRKRMIGVQRELKKEGKDFRAFEILNVGKYERKNYLAVNEDLRAEEKAKQAERKEKEFVRLIITAYKAESVDSFINIVGKKRDRLVAVGPINYPVSHTLIKDIVRECKEKQITKVDVLGFDYEMGIDFQEYKEQGVDIAFKIIPREVFDKRAVEKGQIRFYDVAFIEIKPIIKGKGPIKELAVELTDFSVFYTQDELDTVIEEIHGSKGKTKIVVDKGQIWKVTTDKDGGVNPPEQLTKKWSDWIDYWAVDFTFTSRKEVIRRIDENGEEYDEWTGDYIFENEWQSFRTKKNRNLELVSVSKEMSKGKCTVAVKVVDIFGNDTTRVIVVNI